MTDTIDVREESTTQKATWLHGGDFTGGLMVLFLVGLRSVQLVQPERKKSPTSSQIQFDKTSHLTLKNLSHWQRQQKH